MDRVHSGVTCCKAEPSPLPFLDARGFGDLLEAIALLGAGGCQQLPCSTLVTDVA